MSTAVSKIVFLLSLFLMLFGTAKTQVYPVQLSSQLLPPYSSYLPDYGDPTNEKLKCILVLQDFTVTHRDVKLEITITGNGYTIKTKSSFVPSAINLLPGVPTLITGMDLAPYLETQNLDFTGINSADYELRKILPEGYYSICIKAVDYYNATYTVLSNESCNYAWFFLNDPPFLNFPQCEEEIEPVTPQNIIFQWTAMNLNSPNSVFNTEYDFELFEWRPNNGIPNNIVQNSAPVFSVTTTNPFYQYGILDPTLYLGMKYIWRVRARDLSGRDLFKNDGYSQICSFTYGNINSAFNSDAFTLTLQATASTHRQGKVWWNNISNFTDYLVQVRKAGTENWFEYHSAIAELKINELEPSTAYEARVMGTGNNLESDWSNTAQFTTPPLPVYNCNDQTQPINALSANPLLTANGGMIFQIGQFEMHATQITADPGAPGYFSGFGKVRISLLNIGVKYDHVYINDNLQITAGNVVALSEGIEDWEADWMINQEEVIDFPGNVGSIIVGDSSVTIISTGGDTLNYNFPDMGHPIVVNGDNGEQYTIWPDGTIDQGYWMTFSNDHLDCDSSNKVLFFAPEDMLYGLDNYKEEIWADDYEIIKLKDSTNYYVANKSLKTGAHDFVLAKFNNTVSPLEVLSFVSSTGQPLTSEIVGGYVKVRLENLNDGGWVYAMVDGMKYGKLNLKVYGEEEKQVVIIPVGNAQLPNENTLRTEIQNVFKQGVVKINLTFKPNYNSTSWDLNGDGKLAAGNFNLMQDYSDEMKKLSSDWLAANETDKDAYILFVIPSFDEQNVDKGGYMPLGRHKGFIKSGSEIKIYSHELAHGIFGLEHTFPEVSEGSTDNLMDYTDGGELKFWQWEQMRWIWSQFNLLDDDDESSFYYSANTTMLSDSPFSELLDDVTQLEGIGSSTSICYMLATGHIITVPSEFQPSINKHGFLYQLTGADGTIYRHLSYENSSQLLVFFSDSKFKELDSKANKTGLIVDDGKLPYKTIDENKSHCFPNDKLNFTKVGDVLYTTLLLSDENGNCALYEKKFNLTSDYLSFVSSKISDQNSMPWSAVEGMKLTTFPLPDESTQYILNNNIAQTHGYHCEMEDILRNNGEGKIFLQRHLSYLTEADAETKTALVEVAKLYDELGSKIIYEAETNDWIYFLDEAMRGMEIKFETEYTSEKHTKEYYVALKTRVNGYLNQIKNVETQLAEINDADRLMDVLSLFRVTDYSIFSMDFRIELLRTLSSTSLKGNVNLLGQDEEGEVLKIFSDIQEQEIGTFHEKLLSTKYNGNALLYRFDYEFNDGEYVMGDGNYGLLMGILIDQCITAQAGSINVDELISNDQTGSVLHFGNNMNPYECYFKISNVLVYGNTGNIEVTYDKNCPPGATLLEFLNNCAQSLAENSITPILMSGDMNSNEFSYHPFKDWIVIIPNRTVNINNGTVIFEMGKPYVLPAIGVRYLYQQSKNEANQKNFRIGVNVASLLIGGAGLAVTNTFLRCLAIVDLSATAIDLTLDVFDDEIIAAIGMENFKTIRSAMIITQLASMGGMGLFKVNQYLNKFPALINKIDNLDISDLATKLSWSTNKEKIINTVNELKRVFGGVVTNLSKLADELTGTAKQVHQTLISGGVSFIDDGQTIKYFTKTGDEFAKIENGAIRLTKADGKWPKPEEYLDEAYISNHLTKFDDGIIRVTSKSKYNQYGTLGPQEGFVLPKREFDEIYDEFGGNLDLIEKKLGLIEGQLKSADVLIAWIKKEDISSLKLPSGNEIGVNLNWLPGGKTSGNVSEATADLSKSIPFDEISF